MIEPLVFPDLPVLERSDDGRWIIDSPSTQGGLQSDRWLAAVVRVLYKNQEPPLPVVFRVDPQTGDTPSGRLVHRLRIPLDVKWLRAHAVLPDGLVVQEGRKPSVTNGWNVVTSDHDGGSPRWRAAGWRSGHEYHGPVPPPRLSVWKWLQYRAAPDGED